MSDPPTPSVETTRPLLAPVTGPAPSPEATPPTQIALQPAPMPVPTAGAAPQPQATYATLPPGMVMPNITIVNNNTAAQTGTGVLVAGQKSLGMALVLTFFFGPLGMLYSTVPGAIVTFIIGFIGILLTGGVIFLVLWPIQLIWTYTGVKKHNSRLVLRAA